MRMLLQLSGLLAAGIALWVSAARLANRPMAMQPVTGREVTDLTGQTVVVPVESKRILSLCTSATRTLIELGMGDRLVAIDSFSTVVPGSEHCEVVGKGAGLSRELLAGLDLDLAFIWWYQEGAAKALADAGIPAVRITSVRLADVPTMVLVVAVSVSRNRSRRVPAPLPAAPAALVTVPEVYLELYGPYRTVGTNSYIGDLLTAAATVNVAGDQNGTLTLAPEQLLARPPRVVLYLPEFASEQELRSRPALADAAIRFVPIKRSMLVAGPGWPQDVARLRAAIHDTNLQPVSP